VTRLGTQPSPARCRALCWWDTGPQDSLAGSRASRFEFVLRLMPGGALVAPHCRTSIGPVPIAHSESGGQESERSESEKWRPEGEVRNEATPGSPTEPAPRNADLDGWGRCGRASV
jgi:hypothetical protein